MVLCQILTLVWKSKCIWILTDKKACGKVNRNASYIQQRFVPLIWSSFHSSKCSYNTWRPVNYWAAAASGWATSLSSSDLTPSLTMVIQSKNEQQQDFTPQKFLSVPGLHLLTQSRGCVWTDRTTPTSFLRYVSKKILDVSFRTDYKYGISAIMAFQPKTFITPWPQLDCLCLIWMIKSLLAFSKYTLTNHPTIALVILQQCYISFHPAN